MKSSLVLLVCLGLASCAAAGQAGLQNGRLRACPGSPNCVSSEAGDHSVEPLAVSGAEGWERLRAAVTALGGSIESEGVSYLHFSGHTNYPTGKQRCVYEQTTQVRS